MNEDYKQEHVDNELAMVRVNEALLNQVIALQDQVNRLKIRVKDLEDRHKLIRQTLKGLVLQLSDF